jgi:TRAP-type C4-dicarboxylate transport system substrate-binding protein
MRMFTWKFKLAAAALATATSLGAFAQEVTLRLHQFLPPQGTVPSKALTPWAKKIEEESKGRIKIQLYPSMQLGGTPPQLYDQARDGVVDIVWTLPGYTPGRFPKSEVFELPFIAGLSAEKTSRALWDYVQKNAMDEYKDVHVLALHTHGPGLFHTKQPVTGLESLRGMKIRGGTRVVNSMLVQLGATPVGMPVQTVTLRFHQMLPPQATIPTNGHQALGREGREAERRPHQGAAASTPCSWAAPPQLFDQAKDGVVDITWTVLGYTPGRFPKTEVFELPFMSGNAEPARGVPGVRREVRADEFKDVKLIAVHTHGPGLFHTKEPVTKLERPARHEGARRLAHHQHHAHQAGRHAGGHAGAGGDRGAVQGRDRRHHHSLGSGAGAQGAAAGEEPHHLHRQQGPVHADLRGLHEQGRLRQAAGRPEEGDRRQLGQSPRRHVRPRHGRGRQGRARDRRQGRQQHRGARRDPALEADGRHALGQRKPLWWAFAFCLVGAVIGCPYIAKTLTRLGWLPSPRAGP